MEKVSNRRPCTECHRTFERSDVLVKQVLFATMGKKRKIMKSRTVAHVCPSCLSDDPHWNQQPYEFQHTVQAGKGEDL